MSLHQTEANFSLLFHPLTPCMRKGSLLLQLVPSAPGLLSSGGAGQEPRFNFMPTQGFEDGPVSIEVRGAGFKPSADEEPTQNTQCHKWVTAYTPMQIIPFDSVLHGPECAEVSQLHSRFFQVA